MKGSDDQQPHDRRGDEAFDGLPSRFQDDRKTLLQTESETMATKLGQTVGVEALLGALLLLFGLLVGLGFWIYQLDSQLIENQRALASLKSQRQIQENQGSPTGGQEDIERINTQIESLRTAMATFAASSKEETMSAKESLAGEMMALQKDFAALSETVASLKEQWRAFKGDNSGVPKANGANRQNAANSWSVNLVAGDNKTAIEKLQAKFKQQAVPAERQTVHIDGKAWYRLRVTGFASRREADDYALRVKSKLGLEDVWVSRR